MRRGNVLCALVLAVAGCSAHGSPDDRAANPQRVIVTSGEGSTLADLELSKDDFLSTSVIPVSRSTAWSQLASVYEQLGLPAPAVDQRSWTMAVQGHTVRRRLGDERLSRYVGCGSDMTGQIADSHRVHLNVQTWLEENGAHRTTVRTRVDATASSIESRAGTISCTTVGELETRIATALRERAR